MAWQIDTDTPTGTLTVRGEFNIFSVAEVRDRLRELLAQTAEVTVDLGEVTEADTAGLQLMLLAKRKPGKTVRFRHHSDVVLRLIDLANLGQTLGDPLILQA